MKVLSAGFGIFISAGFLGVIGWALYAFTIDIAGYEVDCSGSISAKGLAAVQQTLVAGRYRSLAQIKAYAQSECPLFASVSVTRCATRVVRFHAEVDQVRARVNKDMCLFEHGGICPIEWLDSVADTVPEITLGYAQIACKAGKRIVGNLAELPPKLWQQYVCQWQNAHEIRLQARDGSHEIVCTTNGLNPDRIHQVQQLVATYRTKKQAHRFVVADIRFDHQIILRMNTAERGKHGTPA